MRSSLDFLGGKQKKTAVTVMSLVPLKKNLVLSSKKGGFFKSNTSPIKYKRINKLSNLSKRKKSEQKNALWVLTAAGK